MDEENPLGAEMPLWVRKAERNRLPEDDDARTAVAFGRLVLNWKGLGTFDWNWKTRMTNTIGSVYEKAIVHAAEGDIDLYGRMGRTSKKR